MRSILDIDLNDDEQQWDFHTIRKIYEEYEAYLEEIRERIPSSVYEFATAEWRAANDPRNPHDNAVESFEILRTEGGWYQREYRLGWRTRQNKDKPLKRRLRRWIEPRLDIHVAVGGPYSTGSLHIWYERVRSLNLESPRVSMSPIGSSAWLYDEIRLTEDGYVQHRIRFDVGVHWQIECQNIRHEWKPQVENTQ